MNDFTKDELKELYYALDLCHQRIAGAEKPRLMAKIGVMIDNYCEHLNTGQCPISEQVVCLDCGEEIH